MLLCCYTCYICVYIIYVTVLLCTICYCIIYYAFIHYNKEPSETPHKFKIIQNIVCDYLLEMSEISIVKVVHESNVLKNRSLIFKKGRCREMLDFKE